MPAGVGVWGVGKWGAASRVKEVEYTGSWKKHSQGRCWGFFQGKKYFFHEKVGNWSIY